MQKTAVKYQRLGFETLEDRSLLSANGFGADVERAADVAQAQSAGIVAQENPPTAVSTPTSAALLALANAAGSDFSTLNTSLSTFTHVTTSTNQNKAFTLSLTSDLKLGESSYYGLKTKSTTIIFTDAEGATLHSPLSTLNTNLVTVTTARTGNTGSVNIDLKAINAEIAKLQDNSAFTTLKAGQSIDITFTVLYFDSTNNNAVKPQECKVTIVSGAPVVTKPTLTATELGGGTATVTIKRAGDLSPPIEDDNGDDNGGLKSAALSTDGFVMKVVGTTIPLTDKITYYMEGGNEETNGNEITLTEITDTNLLGLLNAKNPTLSGSAFVVTGNEIKFTPGTKFQYLPAGVTAEFTVPVTVVDKETLLQTTVNMTVEVTGVTTAKMTVGTTSFDVITATTGTTTCDTVVSFTFTDIQTTAPTPTKYTLTGTGSTTVPAWITVGTDGKIVVDHAGANTDILEGETKTYKFTIAATFEAGVTVTSPKIITLAVTRPNPVPPSLTVTPVPHTITEDISTASSVATVTVNNPKAGATYSFAAGAVTMTANDFGFSGTPTFTSGTDYVIAMTPGTGTSRSMTFALKSGTKVFDFIPAGKTLTLKFTVTVSNDKGDPALTQDITVTINGVNDAPVVTAPATISATAGAAGVTVSLGTTAGPNIILVTDPDTALTGMTITTLSSKIKVATTDTTITATINTTKTYEVYKHTNSAIYGGNNEVSYYVIEKGVTAPAGVSELLGTIIFADGKSFVFTADNTSDAVKALAANAKLPFSLDITVSDGTDPSVATPLSFEIVGINDPPVIVGSSITKTVVAGETMAVVIGTDIIVQDPDNSDTVFTLAKIGNLAVVLNGTYYVIDDTGGKFKLADVVFVPTTTNHYGIIKVDNVNGTSFTFTPNKDNPAIKALAAGVSLATPITLAVKVKDSLGAESGSVDVKFTVTGVNDAPTGVTVPAIAVSAKSTTGVTVAIGTGNNDIKVTDPDTGNSHTFTKIGNLAAVLGANTPYYVLANGTMTATDPTDNSHYGVLTVLDVYLTSFKFVPNPSNTTLLNLGANTLSVSLGFSVSDGTETYTSLNPIVITISGSIHIAPTSVNYSENVESVTVDFKEGVTSPNAFSISSVSTQSIVFYQGGSPVPAGTLWTALQTALAANAGAGTLVAVSGTPGEYTLDTKKFNFLPYGVSAVITVNYTATDSSTPAETANGVKTITVNGANTAPVVTFSGTTSYEVFTGCNVAGTVATSFGSSHTISKSDIDAGDTTTFSLGSVTLPTAIAGFTAPSLANFLTVATDGTFTVTYGTYFDTMPVGSELVYTFKIRVTDGSNVSVESEVITLKIKSSAPTGVGRTIVMDTTTATVPTMTAQTVKDPTKLDVNQPTGIGSHSWYTVTVDKGDIVMSVTTGTTELDSEDIEAILWQLVEESDIRFSKVQNTSTGKWVFTPSDDFFDTIAGILAKDDVLTITIPVTVKNVAPGRSGIDYLVLVVTDTIDDAARMSGASGDYLAAQRDDDALSTAAKSAGEPPALVGGDFNDVGGLTPPARLNTPSTAAKSPSIANIATMYGDVASGVAVVYDAAPSTAVKYDFDFDFSVFEEEDGGDGDDFASLTDAALGVWE